eukprot:tig00001416_g8948.t1
MDIARRFVSNRVLNHIISGRPKGPDKLGGAHEEGRRHSASGSSARPSAISQRPPQPIVQTVPGVIAILDISGFSTLCETASENEQLIEELCRVVNGAFSKEVELAEHYGGDVLSFLGDGLLVFWPVARPEGAEGHEEAHVGPSRRSSAELAAPRPACGPGALAAAERPRRPGPGGGGAAAGQDGAPLRPRPPVRAPRPGRLLVRVRRHRQGHEAPRRRRRRRVRGILRGDRGATAGGHLESALLDERGHLVPGRMAHFIAGPGIEEAGEALAGIKKGEVAACQSALRWLPPCALRAPGPAGLAPCDTPAREAAPSEAGEVQAPRRPRGSAVGGLLGLGLGRSRASHPDAAAPPSALPVGPVVVPAAARPALEKLAARMLRAEAAAPAAPELEPEEEDAVALYVPYSVRARLEDIKGWSAGVPAVFDPTAALSEFRLASVLFCKLEGLGSD